jgi:Tol biopolymer transport system component
VAQEASGRKRLWVRALDGLEAWPLPNTEDPVTPFWSPDGRSIAFISHGALKAVDVPGGAARVIARPAWFGGAWSRDGVILFNPGSGGDLGALHRVSVGGGATEPVTALDVSRRETGHCCPQFLPDGRFLFWATGPTDADLRRYAGSLGSSQVTPLPVTGSYAAPGYLLDAPPPKRTLLVRPFDLRRLESTGPPASLTVEPLQRFGGSEVGWYSASDSGVLAFRPAPAEGSTRLTWFDRTGQALGVLAASPGAQNVELSPDGRRLLLERRDPETSNRDVWVMELDRDVESRLSFDAAVDECDPLWSPDGSRIIWSNRTRRPFFAEAAAAGGEARSLFETPDAISWPSSWSPDGRHLLFGRWSATSQGDLMVLSLKEPAKPQPFLASPFTEMGGELSPDGRWVVYSSDETGRDEIYIRPFPAAEGKWRVSTDGGSNPRWRADGKELFYVDRDRMLMSVAIVRGAASPSPSAPRRLFQTRISGSLGREVRNNYAVHPDGQRFLIVTDPEKASSPPITVIVNWPELLRKQSN